MSSIAKIICGALMFIYTHEAELAQYGIQLIDGKCHQVEDLDTYLPIKYIEPNQQLDIYSLKGEPIELCVFTYVDVHSIVKYRKSASVNKHYAIYTVKDGPLLSLLYSTGLINAHLSKPRGHMCIHFDPWYPPLLYPKHTLYPFKL